MYKYIAILLAAIALVAGTFWFGYRTGTEHELAKQVAVISAEDRMQAVVAEALAKQRPIHQQLKQVIERETRIVPDYSRCINSDVGLRAINSALENQPVSPSDLIVPDADPTG